jgi:hypothetical protein
VHEYSNDPDVVARLAAETAWAIKVNRRYVELRPDDAVALWARIGKLEDEDSARIAELGAALTELIITVGRHTAGMSMREAAPLSVAIHKATMALARDPEAGGLSPSARSWILDPKENAVALEVDPEPPSRVVADVDERRDPACVRAWPGCYSGGYDPACCRFPKSCSC